MELRLKEILSQKGITLKDFARYNGEVYPITKDDIIRIIQEKKN